MKKAFVCLLAFMLVLVVFSSCDNSTTTPNPESGSTTTTPEPSTPTPGSGSSTEAPKEATDAQLSAFESGYTASLMGTVFKKDDASLSSVSIEGDVYKFSDFEVTLDGETVVGTLNGEATITPDKLILNVVFSDNKDATVSIAGKIEISDDDAIFTINSKKCIISNDKIKSMSDRINITPGYGLYANP